MNYKEAKKKINNQINGQYKQVAIFTGVFCVSCEMEIKPEKQNVAICVTTNELTRRGELAHKQSANCKKPLLIVRYDTAMISKELFDSLAADTQNRG